MTRRAVGVAGACAIAIAMTTVAVPSRADAPEETRVGRAYRRFHEGEVLFEQKRIDEACVAFEESQRLDPTLGALLNVAFCHETLGKTATAWAEYNAAAAWAAQQGRADREKFAYEHLSDLAKRLSRVQLVLPEGIDGIAVAVDGVPHAIARTTALVFLDPGAHKVQVSAPRKRTMEIAVQVPPGPATQSLQVPPLEDEKPAPPSRAPVPERPPEDRTTARIVGVALVGLGVVGLGAGTYFGVRTLDDKQTSRAHCAGTFCDATGVAALDDAGTAATISTIGFGVGVAAVCAGIFVLLSNARAPAPVRVAPIVSPRGGGLGVTGAW